ncbi:hypothetical protein ABAC402_14995 [Asticcacaulis sp. AC402]|nr:hypothetical protein ABAC402_14995 [Asticcacaulis sp. AC402]
MHVLMADALPSPLIHRHRSGDPEQIGLRIIDEAIRLKTGQAREDFLRAVFGLRRLKPSALEKSNEGRKEAIMDQVA